MLRQLKTSSTALYLNSSFGHLNLIRKLLPCSHIRVMRFVEFFLEHLKLFWRKRGSVPPYLPFLINLRIIFFFATFAFSVVATVVVDAANMFIVILTCTIAFRNDIFVVMMVSFGDVHLWVTAYIVVVFFQLMFSCLEIGFLFFLFCHFPVRCALFFFVGFFFPLQLNWKAQPNSNQGRSNNQQIFVIWSAAQVRKSMWYSGIHSSIFGL